MDWIIINYSNAFPHRRAYRIAKRVMDVAVCLLIMPVALPLLVICALAIILDSPGPPLFVQERIGKGGRIFRMFKFRTMEHNLDRSVHQTFMKAFVQGHLGGNGDGAVHSVRGIFKRASAHKQTGGNGDSEEVYKPAHASQITRVGRILRRTSLDELPQIWNVLVGEMSLVGPRPNVPFEVEEYQSWHNERLEVLPGITGLAQVRGRSGISFDSIVEYDVEYIENRSLLLDLRILWWTAASVIVGTGAE